MNQPLLAEHLTDAEWRILYTIADPQIEHRRKLQAANTARRDMRPPPQRPGGQR